MMKKTGPKGGQKLDAKYFDQKLIDRALSLLLEYQNSYNLVIIKCMARPHMKRSADLLEEVMSKGITPETIPKAIEAPQI